MEVRVRKKSRTVDAVGDVDSVIFFLKDFPLLCTFFTLT